MPIGPKLAVMNPTDKSPPHLLTLILLTAISVLALNMFLPSLHSISVDLAADYALVNLSVAGFLAITAVLQLIIGPVSDRYGRRPVLLFCIALFMLASFGAMLASNIWVFLAFRVLQAGVIAGGALSRAIVRDIAEPREAARLLGIIAMAMAIAPMLAPLVGGILDELFGWRATFLFLGLGGAIILGLTFFDLGETNRRKSRSFADQFKGYGDLFRSRAFWGYTFTVGWSVGSFYAFLSGAPILARSVLDLSPSGVGLFIGAITGGFFCGSFLSGRFAGRGQLSDIILVGRFFACAGPLGGIVLVSFGIVSLPVILVSVVSVGFGNGLTMPSANVGTMSVRDDLAGSASGLSGAISVGLGALISALTGAVVTAENAAYSVLALMFTTAFLGLIAVLVARSDRTLVA